MTNIIVKCPVTLTVEEAQMLTGILTDHARASWDHARRTKSVAIRAHCETTAAIARDLEATIVRRLYGHTVCPLCDAGDPTNAITRCACTVRS